jgi:hypothetical protein
LRVTNSWWRSSGSRSGLQRATASAWHNVSDNSAGGGGLFRTHLPYGEGWWCVVLSAFVHVRGFVRVVVSASARYVTLLLFLK